MKNSTSCVYLFHDLTTQVNGGQKVRHETKDGNAVIQEEFFQTYLQTAQSKMVSNIRRFYRMAKMSPNILTILQDLHEKNELDAFFHISQEEK